MKLIFSLLFIFLSLEVSASGFFPENNQKIPVRSKKRFDSKPEGLSEQQFNEVAKAVEELYSAQVKTQGGNLVIKKDWNDGMVNAFAEREGTEWSINLFGGLARHPNMTTDSFALIVCHELGHHIGGAVKNPFINTWSTCEGSSDYFAATKCFKKYAEAFPFKNFDESSLEKAAVEACHRTYSNPKDREVCARIGLAAKAAILTLDSEAKINFATPDKTEVRFVRITHPDSQCRLDTYFAGALCTVDKDAAVDNKDYHVGTCTALTHTEGLRPRCWFAPSEKPYIQL